MWSSISHQVLDHRCAAALGAVPHMMLACCAAGRQESLDVTCCHGCPAQVSWSFPAKADGRRDPPEPTVRGALFFLQQLAESAGKLRFPPLLRSWGPHRTTILHLVLMMPQVLRMAQTPHTTPRTDIPPAGMLSSANGHCQHRLLHSTPQLASGPISDMKCM
jgi:hypothetical protein